MYLILYFIDEGIFSRITELLRSARGILQVSALESGRARVHT